MKPKHAIYLCTFFFFLASFSLKSQEFVFIKKKKKVEFKDGKLEESEKFKLAKKIYDDLYEARGDKRFQKPKFVMNRDESLVAWMDYQNVQIGLEEKAFDICASFGDQKETALAILLGHELTHYYEKHAWRRSFASGNDDLEIGRELGKMNDKVENETQADYLGGFLAYSAGYNVFKETPGFLAKVYQEYGLDEKLEGYPSLNDRKKLAEKSRASLERLIEVFDLANFFMVTDKFAEAQAYYKYILREYQSRELYNNLGVAATLEALQLFPETQIKYKFPVEIDLNFSRKSARDGFSTRIAPLLREAIRHFDYAISLDDEYAPAYLNKACAYTLLKDYKRAKFYAETEAMPIAQKTGRKKTISDIKVLLGIIAAREGDISKAGSYFEEAIAEGSHIAARNKIILTGKPLNTSDEGISISKLKKESIDGISLGDIVAAEDYPDLDNIIRIDKNKQLGLKLYNKNGQNSKLLLGVHQKNDCYFLITGDDYSGETALKIKRGATSENIENTYGAPKQILESVDGQILVYKNIIFFLKQNKLMKWCISYIDKKE